MDIFLSPAVIAGAAVVVAVLAVVLLFVKNWIKVPNNAVAVFYGRGESKIVRGGGKFRMPGLVQVSIMSLEPFTVGADARNVYSRDNVPVDVDGVGVVRFGSSGEAVKTATERFLATPRAQIEQQVIKILAGIMRNIVAQMTIEDLNSNREDFRRRVLEEAAEAFGKLGMELDVLTIQNITDPNGYIESLGRGRIAEVKSAADIRTAEAERDATIKSAAARQAGAEATALADTAIAKANRDRDLELAAIQSQVTSEQARAKAAGQQAEQEAQKAIITAQVANERERVEREIGVEELRARKAEQTQLADVVRPAEARRQAAVLDAEGRKAATIADAEAAAETARLAGQAEADARVAGAEADKQEMLARAEGKKAELLAEADGQKALADALNALTEEAARQRVLPDLIAVMPKMAEAAAAAFAQIDRMVLIDAGGTGADGSTGGDTMSRLAGLVPVVVAQAIETVRATSGVDLTTLMNKSEGGPAAVTDGSTAPKVEPLAG